jgi:hypothetical protein
MRQASPGRSLRVSQLSSPSKKSRANVNTSVRSRSSAGASKKLDYYDENDLVNMLQRQIELERELEAAKQDLATRYDFNLFDMWAAFDDLGKGHLNPADIERMLNRLRIFPSRDESNLIVKHYSKGDSRLQARGFNDIFLAKDAYHSEVVSARSAERRIVFSYETERRIQGLLSLHVEAEGLAESLRQRLSRSPSFNTYDAFKNVDCDKNGFITQDEFHALLRSHNIQPSMKDLNALMDIYDRRREGRVSYTDFAQEVSPKSPHKY